MHVGEGDNAHPAVRSLRRLSTVLRQDDPDGGRPACSTAALCRLPQQDPQAQTVVGAVIFGNASPVSGSKPGASNPSRRLRQRRRRRPYDGGVVAASRRQRRFQADAADAHLPGAEQRHWRTRRNVRGGVRSVPAPSSSAPSSNRPTSWCHDCVDFVRHVATTAAAAAGGNVGDGIRPRRVSRTIRCRRRRRRHGAER